MRIGMDLLWVRTGICGGTESYIRNLLDGFLKYDWENEYVLFVANDQVYSFQKYARAPRMRLRICHVKSANRIRRILWENLYLDAAAARCGVDAMFVPVYSKPAAHVSGVPYVSVIHDFQAMHYPQYFSIAKRYFLKYAWKQTVQTSGRLVTISETVRKDLIRYYPAAKNKAVTIYNPVITKYCGLSADVIERRYKIRRMEYFYCVSSLLPHKNLDTILQTIKELPDSTLVISGVGQRESLQRKLDAYRIADRVVLTGFVTDEVRDCLYENCRLFLFPSVFEGFGMPPVEAMRRGKRTVTTRCASLWEVTQGKAVYVKKPYSVTEWKEKIQYALTLPEETVSFPEYETGEIVRRYQQLFLELRDRNVQPHIYEKIYDIVSENEQKAGQKIELEKEVFLCNIGRHPQILDLSDYRKLDNAAFYQAVFYAVYHRLPTREESWAWKDYFDMESCVFQRYVLKKLTRSNVAAMNRMRVMHAPNIYRHRGIWYQLGGRLYGLTNKPTLRQFGKKLPTRVQGAVRKVFL